MAFENRTMADFDSPEFSKFVKFATEFGAEDEIIKLFKRRYKRCNQHFLRSGEFPDLIQSVSEAVRKDPKNKYIQFQRFAHELKAYEDKVKRKRIAAEEAGSTAKKQCLADIRPFYDSTCSSDAESVKKAEQLSKNSLDAAAHSKVISSPPKNGACDDDVVCVDDNQDGNPSVADKLTAEASKKENHTKKAGKSTSPKEPDDQEPSTSTKKEKKDDPAKTARRVAKLEKLLGKYDAEIKRLEEQEVTLEDMEKEDCSYILIDKYKKRFNDAWEMLCKIKGRTTDTGRPLQKRFRYEGSRYPELNRKIEKFVTREKIFPDFQDIMDMIAHVNKKHELKLTKKGREELGRDIFTDVGNKLQERRQEDVNATFGCHLTDKFKSERDPAHFDKTLKRKLESNKEVSKTKMEAVLSKFCHKQDLGDDYEESEEEEEEQVDTKKEAEKTENCPEVDPIEIIDDEEDDDDEGSVAISGVEPLDIPLVTIEEEPDDADNADDILENDVVDIDIDDNDVAEDDVDGDDVDGNDVDVNDVADDDVAEDDVVEDDVVDIDDDEPDEDDSSVPLSPDSHVTHHSDDSDIEICEDNQTEPAKPQTGISATSPASADAEKENDSSSSCSGKHVNILDVIKDRSILKIPEKTKLRAKKVVEMGIKRLRASPNLEENDKIQTNHSHSNGSDKKSEENASKSSLATSSIDTRNTTNKTGITRRIDTTHTTITLPSSQNSVITVDSECSQTPDDCNKTIKSLLASGDRNLRKGKSRATPCVQPASDIPCIELSDSE